MTLQVMPLDKIVPGDAIDSRTTARDQGIDGLARSIKVHGLLQPIVVRNMPDGRVQVVAGNRRLAALQMLQTEGSIDGTFSVETVVRDRNDGDAHELSLVENFQRLPPHPIDQYEAFVRLGAEQDLDAAAIAARFGTSERHVEKMLALGGLHPDIRAAWRDGDLDDEDAAAFTIARGNFDLQKQIFNKLKKNHRLYPSMIRSALGAADHDAGLALKAVGLDAYRAAGGAAVEDLFGNTPMIGDKELLQKLLGEKISARCDELVAEGWSFALDESTVENRWNWRRVQPKKVKPTAEQKAEIERIEQRQQEFAEQDDGLTDEQEAEAEQIEARHGATMAEVERATFTPKHKKTLGCFVKVAADGSLAVEYGIERPEATKAKEKEQAQRERAKTAKANGADPDAPAISNALVHDLSIQFSKAVAETLTYDNPRVALAAVYAALASADGLYEIPLKLLRDGIPALHEDIEEPFEQLLAHALGFTDGQNLMRAVGRYAAQAIEMRKDTPRAYTENERVLLAAIDPDFFQTAARKVFDAEDFFKRAPASIAKLALTEMGLPIPKAAKKADLLEAAIAGQKEKGWLPAEMRLPPPAATAAE